MSQIRTGLFVAFTLACTGILTAADGLSLLREAERKMQSQSLSAEGTTGVSQYKYTQAVSNEGQISFRGEYVTTLSGVTSHATYILNPKGMWQILGTAVLQLDTIPGYPVPSRQKVGFLEPFDTDAAADYEVTESESNGIPIWIVKQMLKTPDRFGITEKEYHVGKQDGLIHGYTYRKADGSSVLFLELSKIVQPAEGALQETTLPSDLPVIVCKTYGELSAKIADDTKQNLPKYVEEHKTYIRDNRGRQWVYTVVFLCCVLASAAFGYILYRKEKISRYGAG